MTDHADVPKAGEPAGRRTRRRVRIVHKSAYSPQFYLTAPTPCPYLEGRTERKVFTHLAGPRAAEFNEVLTQGGFRRSQNIAYRPTCENCRACISVRVAVDRFDPGRSLRRVAKRNIDVSSERVAAEPTTEQFALFREYIDARHSTGGMADMTSLDYTMMIQDTQVETQVVEYRRNEDGVFGETGSGDLLGVALADRLSDGLSMVYSFFDPDEDTRSLGSYMILDHIERARMLGLPYVYLGYWVPGSRKMDYKRRFQPQEHLTPDGWRAL